MSRPSRSTAKAVQFRHDSSEEEDEEELEQQHQHQQRMKRRSNMHTELGNGGNGSPASGGGGGVPAFLAKLWRLVDDAETDNLICWNKDGSSFIIQNQAQFARDLLPLNYKHNNMASFIRQLNMYGFHKITSIENGGLRFDRDEIEFSHPCFKRNFPYLLDHIKRKISNTKSTVDEKSVLKQETVSKVLNDVKNIRGRQDTIDSGFSVMKQENEALWREIASLRQKHAKQQQIVNKLIQFLISIVQPSRNMSGVKRHMQLMINDTPENVRGRTTSETESDSGEGPVIHELSEELLEEVMNPQATPSPYPQDSASPQAMERPRSNLSMSSHNYDYSNQSGGDEFLQMAGGNLINQRGGPPSNAMYTVTEAPDSTHIQELPNSPLLAEEQNVLTTPMVRQQEEERKRLQLKEKNKQRHREQLLEEGNSSSPSPSPAKIIHQPLLVKTEQSEASAPVVSHNNSDLYNVNFLSNDMPTNIFEDDSSASLLVGSPPVMEDAAQFGQSTVNNGKFANNQSLLDASLASTSKAAAAAANEQQQQQQEDEEADLMTVAKYTGDNDNNHEGTAAGQGNGNAQQLLRMNSVLVEQIIPNFSHNTHPHNSSQHSASHSDDVHGHLDNMQDDLDTLKDLLRSDNVSIDQNMLLGLFADSDLLDNYGLSFPNDNLSAGDKKANSGSELMTYQPGMYDLSDILDDNKQQQNENEGRQMLAHQTSVLNTPRHES
ncbi:heat shock factor protein isoform X2 [Drosophila willistoni]|uniref:heat shock factor protein isoform X2 n=1 Tax=Drosophila willistoni TaxID=7260 RepID=UPI000C26C35B|nr:heat shock factor protein isoform X2 [Drosophila willistoni]